MEINEPETKKQQALTMLEPELFAAVESIRVEEDRPMSQMINRLLKTHPRIQSILEAQTAEVSA